MIEKINIDKEFSGIDMQAVNLKNHEFDCCVFKDCNFANSDFSGTEFRECTFHNCNLSMIKLHDTYLKDTTFEHCKMLGINFQIVNNFLLAFSFNYCILNLSSFYKLEIEGTSFVSCEMNDVDFVSANLSKSIFENCNLQGAVFSQTNLSKADLSSSYNFNINPADNNIKKSKFSTYNLHGLLAHLDIEII
jgi:uncharacterized protein YjbI with pentapeptide repeats